MNRSWQVRDYLYYITNRTSKHNIDNVSRTKAYQRFYMKYPEIKWALVASIVSRNAGWNMTDLHLPPFKNILSQIERRQMFMTYERANWLIFSDAYPQLLIYELSTSYEIPVNQLLKELHISSFMIKEWETFRKTKDKVRLMLALIINEQNVIQRPVILQPYFKKNVFLHPTYLLQNYLLLNAVILPTRKGRLYGSFIHGFTNVSNRIQLGKNIASQIFHPNIYPELMDFIQQVEHTGKRNDYEKFLPIAIHKSPMVRMVYPIVEHQDIIRKDWYRFGGIKKQWVQPSEVTPNEIGNSFYKKRRLLYVYHHLKSVFD